MRKLGIAIGIIIVLVIVAAVAVLALVDVNKYHGVVQSQLEQRLNRKVTLGEMHLGIFPPRFQVQNLAIADDPKFSTGSFVQAQQVDVSVKLMPLFHHSVEINSLDLQRPTVELVQNTQGVWNFASLGKPTESTTGGANPNPPARPAGTNQPASGAPQGSTSGSSSSGNEFSLGKLTISDGQVALTDQAKRSPRAVYDHINLTLTDFAPNKPFSIDAAVHLPGSGAEQIHLQGEGGPIATSNFGITPFRGTLDLKGVGIADLQKFLQTGALANTDGSLSGKTDINSENGKIAAKGQMTIQSPRVRGLDVGYPITADYDLSDDVNSDLLRINKTTLKLGETPLFVNGTVNLKPTPAQLDVNLKANDVSIAEAARLAAAAGVAFSPGTTVNGRVNADITARGAADKPALTGTIAGRDVQVTGKDIPQPVQVKAINLALTPNEIRSNDFNVTSGGTNIAARFALRQYTSKSPLVDAAVQAPKAALPEVLAMAKAWGVTGLDKISGAGTLSLDMHAAGPLQTIGSNEILRALNGNLNTNFMNVRLAGTDISHELASIAKFIRPRGDKDQGFTNILKMTGNVLVRNGVAQTNDLQALLDLGNVGVAGTADLVTQALNLRVTAVLSKAASQQVGGTGIGGYMNTALSNNQGEIVIPAIVTGTFQHPIFQPDVQKIAQMRLKGLLPSADNPNGAVTGMLGNLLGQKTGNQNPQQKQQQQQNPGQNAVQQVLGLFGGKKQQQQQQQQPQQQPPQK